MNDDQGLPSDWPGVGAPPGKQPLKSKVPRRRQAAAGMPPGRAGSGSRREVQALMRELQKNQLALELRNEELKLAQEQTEASRRRFTNLYEFAPVGYFTLNPLGFILEVNRAGALLLSEEKETLLNRRMHACLVPKAVPVFNSFLQKVFAQRKRLRCELTMLRNNGARVEVQIEGLVLRGETDGLEQCLAAIVDITERKHAEIILRESEGRFRKLLESVPNVAIQGYAPDGTVRYWNKANETVYGYSAQAAIGRNLLDLIIPPEMHAEVRQVIKRGAETGQMPPASELLLLRKDGSRVPVFSSHVVVRLPGKEPELFCIDIDLTEQKWAENLIRQSEERLRTILQSMPVMLDALDEEFHFVFWNRECERVTGYSAYEMVGNAQAWKMLYPDADYRRRMRHDWEIHPGDYRDWELDLTCKDGTVRTILWANMSNQFPIPGWRTWAVGVDITGRKRAECERESLILELRDALKKVRTLSGLLPICSKCKKIRDDQGYWSQVEIYVMKHSDAQFTHGLCPECITVLFPDDP
jgi:PAS domain S-box-containing protein